MAVRTLSPDRNVIGSFTGGNSGNDSGSVSLRRTKVSTVVITARTATAAARVKTFVRRRGFCGDGMGSSLPSGWHLHMFSYQAFLQVFITQIPIRQIPFHGKFSSIFRRFSPVYHNKRKNPTLDFSTEFIPWLVFA